MDRRSVLRGVLLALAAFGAVGCVPINEAVTGRDLDCRNASEDVCLRAADFGWSLIGMEAEAQLVEPITTVIVTSVDCKVVPAPRASRCWDVAFETDGGSGMSTFVQELSGGAFAAP